MIISFDLDNTLIPYSDEFDVENKTFLPKLLQAESIRKGTIDLFKELETSGHDVWIYTTFFRSIFKIYRTFISFGFKPKRIINVNDN